jgi:hypothetical protein
MTISYSVCLQFLFSLISPYFLWSASFPYSSDSGSNFIGILSLSTLPVCPYHLNLSDCTNFAVSTLCRKPCFSIRVLILQLLLLWYHNFLYYLPSSKL